MNRKRFIAIAALGLAASASAYAGQARNDALQARNEVTVAPLADPLPVTPAQSTPMTHKTWNNVVLPHGVGDCRLACSHGIAE